MRQKNVLTLGIGARMVQHLGGVDLVLKILERFPEDLQVRIKYAGVTYGQIEALINRIGGFDVLIAVLEGRKKIVIEDVVLPLVDQYGRFIPPHGFKSSVVDANREFKTNSMIVDCQGVVGTCQKFLPGLEFSTGSELFKDYSILRGQLSGASSHLSNLLRGPCLPIQVPKMESGDYGQVFEEVFLKGVKEAYLHAFPGRNFFNLLEGKLAQKVEIFSESRHYHLLRKSSVGPVNGLYFPTALQGFSNEGCREMLECLPQGFALSGGIDTAVAAIAYPKVLLGGYSVGLDCAANFLGSSFSLGFRSESQHLCFGTRYFDAEGTYSGGVFFWGFE